MIVFFYATLPPSSVHVYTHVVISVVLITIFYLFPFSVVNLLAKTYYH